MFKNKYLAILLVVVLGIVLLVGGGCGGNNQPGADGGKEVDDKYPERAIEVIVGWGAGGGTDVFARSITKAASEILGQAMPVKNMPGSSEAIAGDFIIQQPADGYTIWAMGVNTAVNMALNRTPHNLNSYIPIARIQHDTAMIQVTKESPFKTIDQLVEYAKNNPGEIRIGGTGAGSFDDVVVALWAEAAGLDLIYVPYEGAGGMHSALLGGHIDVMFEEIGPVSGLVEEGSLIPLMAFTEERSTRLPDIPTSVELGWDITLGNWRGIMVKAGTPDYIVEKLQDAFAKAKDNEEYLQYEADSYLNLRPGYLNSKDFREFIEKEIEIFSEALKKLGHI
ncbi:tripartite tricarboxylate transporter substrate binding protein [Desulfitibacter alkalitolerans]|uniref:tripartite tricarboxylate transporter substrate binding protein n=1 Tax=Desulfitibacter alkalitolerans TaxID=264641 RepID=UPI000688F690|nr:tripartite tricarboxylate transporter substrate binding protein [Desulfitibacter alkalitolerans]